MGELMDIQQTVNDSATSSDLISATVNQKSTLMFLFKNHD